MAREISVQTAEVSSTTWVRKAWIRPRSKPALATRIPSLSDSLSDRYLSHAALSRQLSADGPERAAGGEGGGERL
jgi:hypothetical protein